MASIDLRNITVKYGSTTALSGVNLEVADGEFLTLLGPSGCGKSTLLRVIAGLEEADAGSVGIGGRTVDGLAPRERDVAMVFQSYALYPHMTAGANIAVPLRMRQLSRLQRLLPFGRIHPRTRRMLEGIDAQVEEAARSLGIAPLLHRKPAQLSGGQRQRVALCRAMVRRPRVFLMDEPLSNLDAQLRTEARAEIAQLHARLGATFVYVTHDQVEAMTMSDRIAVMLEGEILQVGAPPEVYDDPEDLRVARLVGSPRINTLPGIVADDGTVATAGAHLPLRSGLATGTPVTLGIRPEAVGLGGPAGPGMLAGEVRLVEHLGSEMLVHVALPGAAETLVARVGAERRGLFVAGRAATLHLAPERVLLFDSAGRRARPPQDVRPPVSLRCHG